MAEHVCRPLVRERVEYAAALEAVAEAEPGQLQQLWLSAEGLIEASPPPAEGEEVRVPYLGRVVHGRVVKDRDVNSDSAENAPKDSEMDEQEDSANAAASKEDSDFDSDDPEDESEAKSEGAKSGETKSDNPDGKSEVKNDDPEGESEAKTENESGSKSEALKGEEATSKDHENQHGQVLVSLHRLAYRAAPSSEEAEPTSPPNVRGFDAERVIASPEPLHQTVCL